ncbi:hypothetical protein K402DRAFT_324837 [Aulographum hederae CBS 113979]|uniref:Tim17-domain-containing protein n=1 Tax=Aulographum hederae CBS 113979 TaxID=1176131 RepID=A0A6G1HAY5_9PEZI|nr:hypothetical protein K402DRAFT_324837 [Aulographum hederae CBS 113979]
MASEPATETAPKPTASSFISTYRSRHQTDRLSIDPTTRIFVTTAIGIATGFGLGFAEGCTTSSLRYRAENAHRLPTTEKGWYLYHKSKNYHVLLGGGKEGVKMGARIGVTMGGFMVVEKAVDEMRGTRDFGSTVAAGLSTAGAFSLWNRFPLITAARTAKMGLLAGLCYGLIQDGVSAMRGNKLGYVEFVKSLSDRLR